MQADTWFIIANFLPLCDMLNLILVNKCTNQACKRVFLVTSAKIEKLKLRKTCQEYNDKFGDVEKYASYVRESCQKTLFSPSTVQLYPTMEMGQVNASAVNETHVVVQDYGKDADMCKVYQLDQFETPSFFFSIFPDEIRDMKVLKSGTSHVCIAGNYSVTVLNTETNAYVTHEVEDCKQDVTDSSNTIISAFDDEFIVSFAKRSFLWDKNTVKPVLEFAKPTSKYSHETIFFAKKHNGMYFCEHDESIGMYDKNGQIIDNLTVEGGHSTQQFDIFDNTLATGSGTKGTILFFDLRKLSKPFHTLKAHNYCIPSVAFYDRQTLLSCSWDSEVKAWNLTDYSTTTMQSKNLGGGKAYHVQTMNDPTTIMSADICGGFSLWNVKTAKLIKEYFCSQDSGGTMNEGQVYVTDSMIAVNYCFVLSFYDLTQGDMEENKFIPDDDYYY